MGLFNNSDYERRLQALETKLANVQGFMGASVGLEAAKNMESQGLKEYCQNLSDQIMELVEACEGLDLRMDIQQERIDNAFVMFEKSDKVEGEMINLVNHDRKTIDQLWQQTNELEKKHAECSAQLVAVVAMTKVLFEEVSKDHVDLEALKKRLGIRPESN